MLLSEQIAKKISMNVYLVGGVCVCMTSMVLSLKTTAGYYVISKF